jgi:signal transduction histidine kinase
MEGQHNKTIADLRKLHVMADLPVHVLQWIIDHTEYQEYEANTMISDLGDSIDDMFMIFKGEYIFYLESNGRVTSTVSFKAGEKFGEVGGLLPYSKMKASPGKAFTAAKSEVLLLNKKYFHELEQISPELVERLVDLLKERIRYFTSLDNQMDKMSALGKLSAGLAHELNNPASAIVRNAKELSNQLNELPEILYSIQKANVNTDILKSVLSRILKKNSTKKYKSLIEKQKAEDQIAGWLDKKNIKEGWIISEVFSEAGLSIDELEEIFALKLDGQLEAAMKFAATIINMNNMINETCNASEHISKLVTAVKSFSHMDRGSSKQYINIIPGITNTLTLLNHKIKKKNIHVVFNSEVKIPKINALEGELNQVWSNLIDNAIDAMDNNGELKINLSNDNRYLCVEIQDSGKGIPSELKNKIFDPFFTTKQIGEGTGLGLDVVNRIIKGHDGFIDVKSEPGKTIFLVKLPINSINKKQENETADHISS